MLEEQTRTHKDLDIVLQTKDLPALRELLAERGDTLRWFGAPDGSERMLSVLQHGHALDEGELVD